MQGCLKNLSVEGGCEGAHARPALFQSIQRAELMKNVPWAISMPLEHWAILRAYWTQIAKCEDPSRQAKRSCEALLRLRLLRAVKNAPESTMSKTHDIDDLTAKCTSTVSSYAQQLCACRSNWQEPLVRGFHPLRPRVCTQALRPREACRKCLRSTTLHLQKAVAVQAGLTPALPTSLSKRRPLRGCAQGSFQGRFAVLLHGGRLPG